MIKLEQETVILDKWHEIDAALMTIKIKKTQNIDYLSLSSYGWNRHSL